MGAVDAKEIEDLIDRLGAIERRQIALLAEQAELIQRLAETVAQNEQARERMIAEQDRMKTDLLNARQRGKQR